MKGKTFFVASIIMLCFLTSAFTSQKKSFIDQYNSIATPDTAKSVECGDTSTCDTNIRIQNCFTPDNDGHNDFFSPIILHENPEWMELIIYDSWANQIYAEKNSRPAWNGIFNTKHCAAGKYIWKLTYCYPGKQKQYCKGIVELRYPE